MTFCGHRVMEKFLSPCQGRFPYKGTPVDGFVKLAAKILCHCEEDPHFRNGVAEQERQLKYKPHC